MLKNAIAICSSFLLALSSFSSHGAQRDGISIGLGVFYAKIDSQIRSALVGDTTEIGGSFDFESDLLLQETSTQPVIELDWAFKQRHILSLNYLRLDRDGSRFFEAEQSIGDRVLVGLIDTQLDLQLWQLRYGYSFFQTDTMTLGVTGGLHMINFDVQFDGKVAGTGDFASEIDAGAGFGNTVPLPNIGIYYDYAINENFLVKLDAQYFDIGVDSLDASLWALEAGVEYYPLEKFSLYMGMSYYDVKAHIVQDLASAEKVDLEWDIKLQYWGPMLMARYRF